MRVMTQDGHVARQLTDACRKIFSPGLFPVSRVGEPSFTSERRISIGTYKEIAAAWGRFENHPRASANVLPLAFALDPIPGSEHEAVRALRPPRRALSRCGSRRVTLRAGHKER
ncbi:hypothetical protein [Streptomyces sp. NBC_01431]|uniref:hypothetical protein n=1 Tax=Streptomyces sp. NBC_01431 TaxID=2903863 RepID=UPI002E30A5FF|nr:hypothetical protein [Streptomyces sp. NBC_01431]